MLHKNEAFWTPRSNINKFKGNPGPENSCGKYWRQWIKRQCKSIGKTLKEQRQVNTQTKNWRVESHVKKYKCVVKYYGEGNGNPLQYSCLENPVDRGAWWAAVHKVAQSQTRLKRHSSSSSEILTIVYPTSNFKVTAKNKMAFLSHQIGKDVLKITTPNIIKHFHALMRTINWSGFWGWQFGKVH